jgi:hypothetical protein
MIRKRLKRRSLSWQSMMVSKEAQVAFNLKKGSLPIRGDVDLAAANDCMKKGLEILASGNLVPTGDMVWSPDIVRARTNDLMVEFMERQEHGAGRRARVGQQPQKRQLSLLI